MVQLNGQRRTDLVEFFREQGRPRPEYTAWSYELGEVEDKLLREAFGQFPAAGVKLVAPMFDGAIVRPATTRENVDLTVIFAHMRTRGMEMVEKPFPRPTLGEQVRKRLRTLRSWTSWVPGPGSD